MAGLFDSLLTPGGVEAAAQAVGAAASGDWAAAAQALGRQTVRKVTIRSQFSPPIEVDPFAPAPPGAPPNPILSLVRPSVTIEGVGGAMTTIAPYGPPAKNYLPWLAGAVVIVVAGVIATVAYVARRLP